jgi:hypothetical protein
MAAASSICQISPTRCQARTRLYRDGKLELEGFPVADISDYLADGSVTIWLDLRGPDHDDLAVLSEEFGLHPLAVEAALRPSQRPKLDRYRSHLLLTAYGARLDTDAGELTTSEIAAFITSKALITVRQNDGLDIDAVVERWDESPDLAKFGVGYLLYGLLDCIVDGQFEAVQSLDDCMEELEDRLFDNVPRGLEVQQRSFQLRKSLVLLRDLPPSSLLLLAAVVDEPPVQLGRELVDLAGQLCVGLELQFLLVEVVIRLGLLERRLPVLADHHERGQEDRFQRHDQRQRRPRAFLEKQHPDREQRDVQIDEVHRPRETGDPVRDPQLNVRGPPLLFLQDHRVVREFDRQRNQPITPCLGLRAICTRIWLGHPAPPSVPAAD